MSREVTYVSFGICLTVAIPNIMYGRPRGGLRDDRSGRGMTCCSAVHARHIGAFFLQRFALERVGCVKTERILGRAQVGGRERENTQMLGQGVLVRFYVVSKHTNRTTASM